MGLTIEATTTAPEVGPNACLLLPAEKGGALGIERMLWDHILLLPDSAPTHTKGGLEIPESSRIAPPIGTIVIAGPGTFGFHGRRRALDPELKPGVKVLYNNKEAVPFERNGVVFHRVREDNIAAIVEGDGAVEGKMDREVRHRPAVQKLIKDRGWVHQ
jgi:co-chaperonin GroES (HSP10)